MIGVGAECAADASLRRARAAVAGAFAVQGLGFACVLTHLPAFKDRWGLDDLGVTVLMFAVAVLAGGGSVLAAVVAARIVQREQRSGSPCWSPRSAWPSPRPPRRSGPSASGIGIYGIALGLIDATTNMQAVALEAEYGQSILTSFHAAWSVGGIVGALCHRRRGRAGLAGVGRAAADRRGAADGRSAPFRRRPDPAGRGVRRSSGPFPGRRLGLLGVALVLFYVADSAASSWSSIYLSDVLVASATVVPLAYGAYQATSLASRPVGDLAVRRYGAMPVVRTAALVGVAGLPLVIVAQGPLVAIVGFAVLGAGVAVVAPLTFAAAGRLAGDRPDRRCSGSTPWSPGSTSSTTSGSCWAACSPG